MSNIEVIQGDAVAELKKIKTNTVDVIVADPPYNLGKDYGNNHDLKNFEEYIDFSKEWLFEAHRISDPNIMRYF